MRPTTLARFLSVLLLATPAPAVVGESPPEAAGGRGFQVIVHPSNPAESVTRHDLADLFLKKQTAWPDGSAIAPVEPPDGSLTRTYFLSDVMNGRSALALKAFWQKKAIFGRTPPVQKASEDEVVAFVRATPGAIGYVAPATAVAGVKVLALQD